MRFKIQIKPNLHSVTVAIPVILTLIVIFWAILASSYVHADPAHCDQPACYSVGYTDGQKNPGNSCPSSHSREFCRGWDDASSTKIRTATSTSSGNSACVFKMFWINNIFVRDKATEKIKLMLILRIIPN